MRTKAIVSGAVVLVVLLFVAMLLTPRRKPMQDITVRHVGSVRSGNITAMTFEITNHTTDSYIYFPSEVQVRNGNGWTTFQKFAITKMQPSPRLDPKGLDSCTVNVTNLPVESIVRFSIRPQKILMGASGFVRRAELKLKTQGGGISLNPYDKASKVFGMPTEVASEEWAEMGE